MTTKEFNFICPDQKIFLNMKVEKKNVSIVYAVFIRCPGEQILCNSMP